MPDSVSNSVLGSSPLVLPRFDLYDPSQPLNLGGYASDNLFVHTNPYIGLAGFDSNGAPVPDTSSAPTSVMLDPTRSPGFLAARALMQSIAQEYGWNNDGSSTPASNPTTTPANTDSTAEDDDEDDDQLFDGRAAMEQAFAPRDSGGGDNTAPSPNIQPAPLSSTGNGPVSMPTQPTIPETNASSLPSWWNQPVVTPSSPASGAPSMRLFGDDSLDTSPSIATLTPRYSNPADGFTANVSIPGPALASSSGPVFLKPQTPVAETNPPPFSAPYGVTPSLLPQPAPAIRLSDAYSLPPTYSLPTQARDSQPVLLTDGPMYEPTIGFEPWPMPTSPATDQSGNSLNGTLRLPDLKLPHWRFPTMRLPHWQMPWSQGGSAPSPIGQGGNASGASAPVSQVPGTAYPLIGAASNPSTQPAMRPDFAPTPSVSGTNPALMAPGMQRSLPPAVLPNPSQTPGLTAALRQLYTDVQKAGVPYRPTATGGMPLPGSNTSLFRNPSFHDPALNADAYFHTVPTTAQPIVSPAFRSQPSPIANPAQGTISPRNVSPVPGSAGGDRYIESAFQTAKHDLNSFYATHTRPLNLLADPRRWPFIPTQPKKPGDRSVTGFGINAWNDALSLLQGVTQLPTVAKEVAGKVVDSSFYNTLAEWDDLWHNEAARRVHQAQADADGEWLWNMATGLVGGKHGVVSELGMLAGDGSLLLDPRTDPRTYSMALHDIESRGLRTWQGIVDYSYQHPAQQALNLLMVGEASAASREAELGRALEEAEAAGDEAKAARLRIAKARVGAAKTVMQRASHHLTTLGVPEGVKLMGRGVDGLLEGQAAYRNARNMVKSAAGRAITSVGPILAEPFRRPVVERDALGQQSPERSTMHRQPPSTIREREELIPRRHGERILETADSSAKDWDDVKRLFNGKAKPVDTTRLTEEFQNLSDIVGRMTLRKTAWSGVVSIVDAVDEWGDAVFNGAKNPECSISMHRNRLQAPLGVRMRTMVHETFHAFSEGLNSNSYNTCPGYEEAVVEQCTRLYGPEIYKEAKIKAAFPRGEYYQQYVDAMETCRRACGETNMKKFYVDLLRTPLTGREAEINRLVNLRYNGTVPPNISKEVEKALEDLHKPYQELQKR